MILTAIQQQGEAIQALAQSVAQMTKAINCFLFADRRTKGSSEGARHRGDAGQDHMVEELRKKSDEEWQRTRIERLTHEKLQEIADERIRQAEATKADSTQAFKGVEQDRQNFDLQVAEAIAEEKDYARCNYRRTTCKALETLIHGYNKIRHHGSSFYGYEETGNHTKCRFNQFGSVASKSKFLVDPGRFWSYDLLRTQDYSERPV